MAIKVYFRADGEPEIGLGHLVRCIALAHMIKNSFGVIFVCRQIPLQIIQELNSNNFDLVQIESETSFFEKLNKRDIVVLDGYNFDTEYQKSIKAIGCKLVCIDDLHDKEFVADLIINHAPGIVPSDYKAQPYTRYALGLDYVLLRPVFLNKAKAPSVSKTIQTVFVCFGGSDAKNITQRVVEILKGDRRFKKIILVVGAAYNYLDKLKLSIADDKRFHVYYSIDAEIICNLITDSELAIVPASGILQEVLATGCRVISGMYVKNQSNIFSNFKALGAFKSAGNFSIENLVQAINESFTPDNLITEKFIDGKSDKRLLEQFIMLGQ